MTISHLTKVPLRQIWAHEAYDFTTWLAENLDFLGEAIGSDLTLIEQEAAAGPFAVDILAENPQGHSVVIENQLEKTDHDHLGKLITYLSNLEAKTAIWITSDPRPEHEAAVHWLNETMPADTSFYLLKIEAYRIDDSNPAPLLTIVAGPSLESKQVGAQKKELAERHVQRLEFWAQLLERAQKRTSIHANISPGTDNWISAGAGKAGLTYSYVVRMNDAQVELDISTGDRDENKRIFDTLYDRKEDVEGRFGGPLNWERKDDRIASFVRFLITGSGLQDSERWETLQEKMIDAMIRLEQALEPEIRRL